MNVIFMGTPDFAVPCLEKLIEKHNVIAVFSQPDKPVGRKQILTPPAVKKCANEHKIDVFQPNSLKDNDIIKQIEDMNADIIVVHKKLVSGLSTRHTTSVSDLRIF